MAARKPKDDDKKSVGRPPKAPTEPIGPAKLFVRDKSKLRDYAKWRSERLKIRDYGIAEAVRDLFRAAIHAAWDAEMQLSRNPDAPQSSPIVVPKSLALTPVSGELPRVPFVGPVAAGTPIHVFDEEPGQWLDLASLGGEGRYAFRVKGDSMTEHGIIDGDYVVVRREPDPRNGEDVVAVVNGEMTLKKLVVRPRQTILVSCDGTKRQITFDEARGDHIIGALVGVVRKK